MGIVEKKNQEELLDEKYVVTDGKDTETTEVVETSKKEVKKEKNKKKESKPREHKLARKVKETTSELKKVSWPTFAQVCKRTGIVVAFVLICTLVLFGIDRLLSLFYTFLIGK